MNTPTTYAEFVNFILGIINLIVPALFAFLFVYFIWKIVDSWVIHAGDEIKQEEGRRYATAAVIAFVVMISVWGVVAMIRQSLFG